MARKHNLALAVGCFLFVEVMREWFVLRTLGFQPDKFVQWIRED